VSLSTAGDLALPSQNYSSDDDSEDSLSYGIVSMPGSSLSLQHQAALEEVSCVSEVLVESVVFSVILIRSPALVCLYVFIDMLVD